VQLVAKPNNNHYPFKNMKETGIKNPAVSLESLGLKDVAQAYWNLPVAELVEHTIVRNQGELTDTGAILVNTGEFTGRSPEDKFSVEDDLTRTSVDWNKINQPFAPEKFDKLYAKVLASLKGKEVYISDVQACADPKYRINVRVMTETPWANHFARNMFMRPSAETIATIANDWSILCVPSFMADAAIDGTRQHNFSIINFTKKQILIGGSGYTGEIKKGIFTVLNYTLPHQQGVLSMHCSANVGRTERDTAIFFGLSGTGKTTLSADANRDLIGDDEHGWSDTGVFNFEGGCYAKTIKLSLETEPEIYKAIKHGAILENIPLLEGTRTPDYDDDSITPNTRVSYPLHHIENAMEPSIGGHPKNIFFLACDSFGILPPISRLTPGQAKFFFINGYTAKIAGTEAGIKEPQPTFSACFGAAFLPLHPTKYAKMLGDKLENHEATVWLVNTGWNGGEFGVGSRMKLSYTRAMITAVLNGELQNADFENLSIFDLAIPTTCTGVPDGVLNPTWKNEADYLQKASDLANKFNTNFGKYSDQADAETLAAAPKTLVK
jgi:phosphoenolpyruvate carboxykinase (ATP)